MTDEESVIISSHELYADSTLIHEGVLRRSGRYPWGSGENPAQRNKLFLDYVADLKKKGMSDVDIARAMDTTTSDLRNSRAIAKTQKRAEDISTVQRLKEKGLSNVAIGEKMGIPESSVRALADPSKKDRNDVLTTQANLIRDSIDKNKYVDVGVGVENHLGISNTKLKQVVALLKDEGYTQHTIKQIQQGTGKETTLKVLAKPGVEWKEVKDNRDQIRPPAGYSDDGGRTVKPVAPVSFDSKRLMVKYGDEGGADKDGVLELRRNVDDISLGGKLYAQVRVKVDDSHYLKGMAMYADDLPDGVDIRFNTNKTRADVAKKGEGQLGALKPMDPKAPPEYPFGAITKPRTFLDKNGKEQQSKMNIVNEEGSWNEWGKNLSSQVLSKQSPAVAKTQLDLRYKEKKDEYDEIMSLTNPTVRKRLLQSFADDADSSAVHLKAAALPRQRTQVILPISSMKDNEVFAPNFRPGENVVLIRYPHGGIFEIPELKVNNSHPEARRLLGGAKDAIGISSKVAARLSGADFDGDTVLVIPNNYRAIKNAPKLKELEGFDPQAAYPKYDGMKVISARTKQLKMGDVSNLITDMTIQGATYDELARAVKHSMVVIDSEKHKLNWQQSAKDNRISELKAKYQDNSKGGAYTLISKASSKQDVPERKLRSAKDGGPIDPETGKLVYEYSGDTYIRPGKTTISKNGISRTSPDKVIVRRNKISSTKMAEVDDADILLSPNGGTAIERVYADHANRMKALANQSRKSYLQTPNLVYSPTAKKAYSTEVETLKAKLNKAYKNKPLERQAQLLAGTLDKAYRDANPDADAADIKKNKGRALETARTRVNANKERIAITPKEWEAIQAGAISNSFLKNILDNTDETLVKSYAMPRTTRVMTPTRTARAKAMLAAGHDRSDVADALGISISTLDNSLKEGGAGG